MSLELPYSIQPTNAFFLEKWQGPYTSVAAANAAVPSGVRLPGKTVVIDSGDGQITEYWWKGGIADGDLVEKTAGTTGDFIPLTGSDQISGDLFGNVDTLKVGLENANVRSTSLSDTNVVNASVELGGYSSFFEASANDVGEAQAILAAQGIDFSELRSFSVVNNQEFLFFGDVAKYNVDRSTEIDSIDFALPNKEWVLAAISAGGGGGGNTFENGLTRDSGTGVVTLGGQLSSTVIIDGDGVNPVEFNIGYNNDLQAFNVRAAYSSYTAIGDNSGFSMVTLGATDGGTGLPDVCSASIIISQPDQTSAIAVFGASNTATLYTPVVACSSLGWVVIGDSSGAITTPNPKSALEIISTNQTFVPPCMTYAQKIAIGTPKVGSMVYQTNANGATDPIGMYVYKQTGGWKLITTA